MSDGEIQGEILHASGNVTLVGNGDTLDIYIFVAACAASGGEAVNRYLADGFQLEANPQEMAAMEAAEIGAPVAVALMKPYGNVDEGEMREALYARTFEKFTDGGEYLNIPETAAEACRAAIETGRFQYVRVAQTGHRFNAFEAGQVAPFDDARLAL